ncbi:MAG: hypothetical protein BroJett011_24870 [Chloroflexota bacterium]|nr:MAG: hypothetical protein BroJett011_24870 [Chloroflexota bacterium]
MTSQRMANGEWRSLRGSPYSLLLIPYFLLRSHPGLVLALAVYLGLAFCYFFITPIFEAPDEWTHTGHVKYLAEGKGLPVMLPGQGIWGGQQPPLYYAIGALLVQPFELDSFDDYLQERVNPHASLGYALDPGNKNNFLHTSAENFPYHGLALTVHILRLYSMAYGLITLIFTYLTALEIFDLRFTNYDLQSSNPKSFAAFVALFVACQPMFAFITASVANEPANMAFCAVGLWLAQRYVLYGPSPHWRRAVALGLVLGFISLSKMTGLSFGLVAAVAFLLTAVAARKQPGMARLLWRDGLIIGLLFLAVGGWWYWRNYQLYGDFFQRGLYQIYFNAEQQPLTLGEFLYTLSTGEVSFWATFGWLNIVAPEWVYTIYRIISRVGLVGVVLAGLVYLWQWVRQRMANGEWRTHRASVVNKKSSANLPTFQPSNPSSPAPGWGFILHPSSLILHLLFPIALAFSLTRLVAIEGGLQGRQLLPALGSIAIIIVAGWWALSPARLRLPLLSLVLAIMMGLAAWLPFGVVAPEYFPTPLLTEAGLPADLARLNLTYRDEMKLIGVKIDAAVARPGERVPVSAYWQALKPMTTNYSVFVHLIGRGYRNVGQFNTYPGLGLRPTRTLQPGQIIADTYPVMVEGGAAAPTRLLVNIGLFDFSEPGRPGIEATGPNGQPAASTVGQLKLIPARWPSIPDTPSVAEFEDAIHLTGTAIIGCQRPGQTCEITFKWLAESKPAADYTVFIQLWPSDPQQKFIGFDSQPLSGDYPTSLWDSGEVILDPHELDLSTVSPGKYRVLAGLYNLSSGVRLPARAAGMSLPDDAINLGNLQIKS